MRHTFNNKIALITGAASGIGRALAFALADYGAHVIATDLHGDGAAQVAASINERGGQATSIQLDVTDRERFIEVVGLVSAENKRLDYLFNNAGIGITGEARDMTLDQWQTILQVNLESVITGTHAAYQQMVKQGYGHIINTASLTGLIGLPFATPYAATKAAVLRLSTSLRTEAKALGVNVTVVCPGFIDTPIYDNATLVNVPLDAAHDIPFKLMPVEQAAQAYLKGVSRNQAIVVFPFHAKLLWWLSRINDNLIPLFLGPSLRAFRAKRIHNTK